MSLTVERPWAAAPISTQSEEALIAFVIRVLGQVEGPGEEILVSSTGAREDLDRTPHASSAERVATRRWAVETASCVVEVLRTERCFPGDVNEPPRDHTHLELRGTRRDGTRQLIVHAHHGSHEVVLHSDAGVEAVAAFRAAFGTY